MKKYTALFLVCVYGVVMPSIVDDEQSGRLQRTASCVVLFKRDSERVQEIPEIKDNISCVVDSEFDYSCQDIEVVPLLDEDDSKAVKKNDEESGLWFSSELDYQNFLAAKEVCKKFQDQKSILTAASSPTKSIPQSRSITAVPSALGVQDLVATPVPTTPVVAILRIPTQFPDDEISLSSQLPDDKKK